MYHEIQLLDLSTSEAQDMVESLLKTKSVPPEKSVKRFAVEESHQYYKKAFDILASKPDKSKQEEELLIDLLIKWCYVYYYRGDFNALTELLSAHEDLAESIYDKVKKGMFNAWFGFALFMNGMFHEFAQPGKSIEMLD